MMIRPTLLVLFCLVAAVRAQNLTHGPGEIPRRNVGSLDGVPLVEVPRIDAAALQSLHTHQREPGPGRYAEPWNLHITTSESGIWETKADGTRRWRLHVSAPGSLTIAMVFDHFHLPPGAEMYVYAPTGELVRERPYTELSNPRDGVFATGPLPADEAIVELNVASGEESQVSMVMTRVNRGFVKLATMIGRAAETVIPDTSQSCEVNITCPQGQGKFKNASNSVGMIVTADGAICSGSLLNDASSDYRQFFLTASHCGTPSGWNVVFDFESATCARGGASSLANQVGNIVEVARNDLSDFLLVEIQDPIPPNFNVFFNGWFAMNLIPLSGAVVIHHPEGNVKKISATFDPLADSTFNGLISFTDWRIDAYNLGITEPGSSGAPLLNTNTQVIGQVHGGFSSCDPYPGGPDYFGKFSLSFYAIGATATQVLQTFLDPTAIVLNGPLQIFGSYPAGSLLSQVWTNLNALLAALDPSDPAAATLQSAIDQLNTSLNPQYWNGPGYLNGTAGATVFTGAGAAGLNLQTLINNDPNSFPPGTIQGAATSLTAAIRAIVTTALVQSDPGNLPAINGFLAAGDAFGTGGDYVDAIAQYGSAWALERHTLLNPFTNVSANVNVTQSGFTRNRATGLWSATLTVTNTGGTALNGLFQAAITNLSSNAAMVNNIGLIGPNSGPLGIPYVTIYSGTLAPGASANAIVQFTNPTNGFINYTPVTIFSPF